MTKRGLGMVEKYLGNVPLKEEHQVTLANSSVASVSTVTGAYERTICIRTD